MKIVSYLPITDWLPNYKSEHLKGDLAAGLTVGVMLVPQGMAYAMIAGLPPIYGLYASTLPLIIYAILGTSRQLAVGPTAMVSLLTAAGVGMLAEGGTELYIQMVITLAFLVGVLQFLLGAFRLGFLVNFLSQPVIRGFTSAAALIIGLSQLKHLLGVDITRTLYIHEILIEAIAQFGAINWMTFGIGMSGIVLIKLSKKIHSAIPGALVAVVFGIVAVWGLGLYDSGVRIVGAVPKGLPSFQLPILTWVMIQPLLPVILAISLVSFVESIAVAKAIQAKHKDYKVAANQELIALGLAKVGGAFFQAYPSTGGLSRTAVNDQAGAKTGLAGIISAVFIVFVLLFLTPLFFYLPQAVLASIIMVAVFGLIDFKEPLHLWKTDRSDFWMLIITFLGTLILGIELGIGIGVVLSLGMIIYQTSRPHVATLGRVPGTDFYRNTHRFDQLEERADILIVRFDAQLYFANLDYFRSKIEAWVGQRGDQLQLIIINANSINNLDSSALYVLEEMMTDLRAAGMDIYFTGVKGPLRDMLVRAGVFTKIGENNFFMNVAEAVKYYDRQPKGTRPNHREYVLQTNLN